MDSEGASRGGGGKTRDAEGGDYMTTFSVRDT
jgi:hypothetical protein